MKPTRLQPGDKVHLVSPASTPPKQQLDDLVRYLQELELQVEVGTHALDRHGYLAGKDEDRIADLNHALRDPEAKAIIATRGGKGAYRIAHQMDFDAAAANPKLLIGFSEITILQMALLKNCGLASLHGAAWSDEFCEQSARSFRNAVFSDESVQIRSLPEEATSVLTTTGRCSGVLIGGNQSMLATAHGWALPSLDGAILLLEAFNMRLGHIDRQLTRLRRVGVLDGIVGVAVGQYAECGPDETTQGDWSTNDVLRDNLHRLNVPVLGGLPLGHGNSPLAVPIGTMTTLDADAGLLTVEAAVSQ